MQDDNERVNKMTLPSKKEEKGIKWGKLNFRHFVVDFVRPVHWQHFLAAPGLFQVLCQFYVIISTKPFEKKCRTYLLFSQSILVFELLLKAHDRTFMLCNRLQWFLGVLYFSNTSSLSHKLAFASLRVFCLFPWMDNCFLVSLLFASLGLSLKNDDDCASFYH